jgi:hypothetical protein
MKVKKTWRIWRRIVILLLAVTVSGVSNAGISVSLTINGDLDEILAIVQQLKRMGLGEGIQFDAEDPLKLRVHSVHEGAEAPAETPLEPAAPQEPAEIAPVLALRNAAVSPASVPAGAGVQVSVEVVDKEHLIDTLAATLGEGGPSVDLYDNATGGDVTAGDGNWSANLLVPAEIPEGAIEILITAYDASGSPLMVLTPDHALTRITTSVTLNVVP